MIALISKWKLRNGCPKELQTELKKLAKQVRKEEKGTLMYAVNLQAIPPLDTYNMPINPPPKSIPLEEQTEVVFIEIYKDVEAFSTHVNGPTFTKFRKTYLKYFLLDPLKPGWPLNDTEFLIRESVFIRLEAG
jgi:quinol monooxygenase YgiN